MINVLFFVQYKSMGSSSRGIMSGGRILDFGDLCDAEFMSKVLKGNYKLLYQVGRGELRDLVSMRLDEFESIFYPHGYLGNIECLSHLLGFNSGVSVFRKEITDKYGPQKEKLKTTSVYDKGTIITGADGTDYLYLGNMQKLEIYIDKELKTAYSGHLYIPLNYRTIDPDEIYKGWLKLLSMNYKKYNRYFLKTKKKATAVKNKICNGLTGEQEVSIILGKCYLYRYDRVLTAKSKEA